MGASAQPYLIPAELALNNAKLDYTADSSLRNHCHNKLKVYFGNYAHVTQSGESIAL